jgi:hypothetical protein
MSWFYRHPLFRFTGWMHGQYSNATGHTP